MASPPIEEVTSSAIDWQNLGKLVHAVLVPNVGGFLFRSNFGNQRSFRSDSEIFGDRPGWYQRLVKPAWSLPDQVFEPIWACMYFSMGYASYLVYRDGEGFEGLAKTSLMLYSTQLVQSWSWTPILFKYRNLKWNFINMSMLTGTAAACGILFFGINKNAGYLFIPYVAWLAYNTALSCYIWKNNPKTTITIEESDD